VLRGPPLPATPNPGEPPAKVMVEKK